MYRILLEVLLGCGIFSAVILLLTLGSPPPPVSAHSGGTFGPNCGQATIDGVVNSDEWSTASKTTIQMVPPGSATPFSATLYVMNSKNFLYIGITINDDEFTTYANTLPGGDGFRIDFDNNNSGTLFALNDDVLSVYAALSQFEDAYIYNGATSSARSDIDGGGTHDGFGAASRLGDLNHFELIHPLCSGDSLDFCLQPTNTVGFRLEYLDAEANGTFGGTQLYPGTTDTSESDIVIGNCAIPDIFIFLPFVSR